MMTPQLCDREEKRELLEAAAEEVKTAVLLSDELDDEAGHYCAIGFLAAKCEGLNTPRYPSTDEVCQALADFFGLPYEDFEVIYKDNDSVDHDLWESRADEDTERSRRAAEHFKRIASLLEAP